MEGGIGVSDVTSPLNVTQLNARLAQVAAELGIPVARARVMLCTLIVSQMLPDAVAVKGGMGVKLRFGERGTRATSDLDVSTRVRGEEFEQVFRARLAEGWGTVPASKGELRRNPDAPERIAFTATVRAVKLHDPGLARPEYVMHPYRVSIAFLGADWGALDVEVSDPEIDPYAHSRKEIDGELVQFGAYFGFGDLRPVELVDLEYQIAQKLSTPSPIPPTCERTTWSTCSCSGTPAPTCRACTASAREPSTGDGSKPGRRSRCAR